MIYLDLELTRSSSANLALLMRGLSMTGGKITSMFYLNNGFPEDKFGKWSTFYRLEFSDQDALDSFHDLAFSTDEPEQISLYGFTEDNPNATKN